MGPNQPMHCTGMIRRAPGTAPILAKRKGDCPRRATSGGLLLAACVLLSSLARPAGAEPLPAVVSIAPLASLVERIGGQRVTVRTLVGAGQDPHTFSPTPRLALELGRAKMCFTVGLPFESRLLERVQAASTGLTVVDTTRGFTRREAPASPGEHVEGGPAPSGGDLHVWLAPEALRVMAANVAQALQAADPAHRDQYQNSLRGFLQDVDAADARMAARLAPWRGRTICVYHPALGYFCDRYGLMQRAVETGGKAPTPRQLRQLIQQARAENVKVVFVQKQFDQRAAQTVAQAIGGRVVAIDPLAKDVLENLQRIAETIDRAMQEQPESR